MYKVFVNDCPIIFSDSIKFSDTLPFFYFNKVNITELVRQLFQNQFNGVVLVCENIDTCWDKFKTNFKTQFAAGGKVVNELNEILFIYRFNKWDLPKGKLEKNESVKECAVREVKEECGVSNLKIVNELETTYHIFEYKNELILKKTYWFLMKTSYMGKLKPQFEEGIERAVFKNEEEIKVALNTTYANIKLLFNS